MRLQPCMGFVSASSHVCTTEYVRAPEVILGGAQLTPAIDAWALGVVCMGLLCGSLVVWRDARFDTPHPHLLMCDAPLEAPQQDLPGLRTLTNTARLLGPLPPELWQEMARDDLGPMHESPYGNAAAQPSLRQTPAAFLTDDNLVKRCVDVHSLGLDFVVGLLRWQPTLRRRATGCGSHAWFRERQGPLPPAEETLLSHLDTEALQLLVRRSLLTGLPVRTEDVAGVGRGVLKAAAVSSPPAPSSLRAEAEANQKTSGGPSVAEWWLRGCVRVWRSGSLARRQGVGASQPSSVGSLTIPPSQSRRASTRPARKRRRATTPQGTAGACAAASSTQLAPTTPKSRVRRKPRGQQASQATQQHVVGGDSQVPLSQSVANPA